MADLPTLKTMTLTIKYRTLADLGVAMRKILIGDYKVPQSEGKGPPASFSDSELNGTKRLRWSIESKLEE